MLESHGYILRPRFRREWTPSWKKPGNRKHAVFSEDSYQHARSNVIDAIRQSDGRRVFLKIVRGDGFEQRLSRMLGSEEKLRDPQNHCVPILDFFLDGRDGYLVMPLLIRFDRPPFFSVDEVLDFMRQTLEGISYLHSQNVAHRDCSYLNIMMDGTNIYPNGFHPTFAMYTLDGLGPANPQRRRDVSHVKYYFTDFGISSDFNPQDNTRLVTGVNGQDRDVPELSRTVPYDPFAVDVFILGNLYCKQFLKKYTNLGFLTPLVDAMTRKDPKSRPTIDEAMELFENIISRQRKYTLTWRLKPATDGRLKHFIKDVGWISREGFLAIRNTLGFR
ncbi:uncharacterized protein FOMMEDRAFT_127977 [Fomitiporia mediterranea MF3/22]|uniref:uncharacterized protein n=1 Tax=Fomitiporia mediterranea (strain MF3/22) TaxID=694068 RepID=UPI0004407B99|nr:uncharacterized protein FOMMEDRAFT_127977 [Fomitiporia mediterranea MF3/22]EJC99794.1 hypothetical protein FOMMEDRAFT_127977 [Fomitiporia mediterranea MF3/22]